MTYTEVDFDNLSWHDCNVWRIEFRVGDPEENDWTSDLVLGIDFITAWLCGVDRMCRFMVAPATLVFHDLMDLSIHIDWDKAELAHEASIHRIERELVDPSEIKQRGWHLDRSTTNREIVNP